MSMEQFCLNVLRSISLVFHSNIHQCCLFLMQYIDWFSFISRLTLQILNKYLPGEVHFENNIVITNLQLLLEVAGTNSKPKILTMLRVNHYMKIGILEIQHLKLQPVILDYISFA